MTLTSEYQYIGRSNAVSNPAGGKFYILLYARTSGDTATGRHAVTVKQRLACTSGYDFYGWCTSGDAVVDGTTAFSWFWATVPDAEWTKSAITEDGVSYNRYVDLKEGTVTVDVGYAKTKNIDITAYWVMNESNGSTWLPTANMYANASVTVTLPMIAGASQPTAGAAAVVMGEAVELRTNRVAGSGFTHTLSYSFGAAAGVIAENVADSVSWTPPVELARQIPNALSGTAVITCQTFSGSTKVGEKQVTLTLTVPESAVPTVSLSYTDSTGVDAMMGVLVQNVSRLAVTAKTEGAYGSTVTGTAVTLNGKAYAGGTVTESGTLTLAATVTDSRGRKGTCAVSVSITPYAPPRLTLAASRCLSDGTADDTGEYARITVSGFVTQVNGCNRSVLTLSWGGSSQTVEFALGAFSYEKIVAASSNATMAISAVLSDRLIETSRDMTLSTGYATLDLLSGGKGIAFGKTATRAGFDCAMPAYFTGGLQAEQAVDGETEYLSPPLLPGVEYRTVERFNGRPVYTKLIETGTLVEGANVIAYYGSLYAYAVRVSGKLINTSGLVRSLPFVSRTEGECTCVAVFGNIKLDVGGLFAGCTAQIQVWYTKQN